MAEVYFIVEQQPRENGEMETTKREWFPGRLMKSYGEYFVKKDYCNVSQEEYYHASKTIDLWIEDFYKDRPEVLAAYTDPKLNAIPPDIEKNLPKIYKVHWDTLTKINQNNRCMYRIVEKPIPGWEDLKIHLWSGYKTLGPFISDFGKYYNTITLFGEPSRIDKFMKPFLV